MKRAPAGFSELVSTAWNLTGDFHWVMNEPDFFIGADPVFAGLSMYEDVSDGRSYRDTAHVLYPHHQKHLWRSDRVTTVVWPGKSHPDSLYSMIHELGHVLHGAVGFAGDPEPISGYAGRDRFESFAEAFSAFILHPLGRVPPWFQVIDPADLDFFERLAGRVH